MGRELPRSGGSVAVETLVEIVLTSILSGYSVCEPDELDGSGLSGGNVVDELEEFHEGVGLLGVVVVDEGSGLPGVVVDAREESDEGVGLPGGSEEGFVLFGGGVFVDLLDESNEGVGLFGGGLARRRVDCGSLLDSVPGGSCAGVGIPSDVAVK